MAGSCETISGSWLRIGFPLIISQFLHGTTDYHRDHNIWKAQFRNKYFEQRLPHRQTTYQYHLINAIIQTSSFDCAILRTPCSRKDV